MCLTVAEIVVRLLANLTQPAIICFQGELPEEKTNRNFYLEVEEHLQLCKQVCVVIFLAFLVQEKAKVFTLFSLSLCQNILV